MTNAPLLELQDVRISYFGRAGESVVVPGLSFALGAGEALGLVGESGCGKSTVALAIVRYLGRAGRVVGGRILFEGRDLAALDEDALRAIRGRRIAMVYQDPMASLNPVMPIGRQLMEVPMLHEGIGAAEARVRALRMLGEVNLPDPEAVLERYPHQLSGGQQQRIVIAMALIAEPALLIMDEPTTGLDVTVEAAVLDLVRALRRRHNSAILFISHNLGTVVRVCDRIGVMYAGELVEEGTIRQVFADPRHPYTRGLLGCLPTLGRDKRAAPLVPIPGQLGSPLARPAGCGFAARCAHVDAGRCTARPIAVEPVAGAPGPSRPVRPGGRAGAVAPGGPRRPRGSRRGPGRGGADPRRARARQDVPPVPRRLRRPRPLGAGPPRREPGGRPGTDPRHRRRVGLRQVHPGPGAERAPDGDGGVGDPRRRRGRDRGDPGAPGSAQAEAPDGLPEPRQHPEPQPHGGVRDRPRAPAAQAAVRGGTRGGRSRGCSRW